MNTVIQQISNAIDVIHRTDRSDLRANWRDLIDRIDLNCLPHGSGFDNGSNVAIESSTRDRIVINTAFHHMSEHGFYSGWTDHKVIVTPCFSVINIRVTGRDRNGIKDYIADVFRDALRADCSEQYHH